MTKNQMSQQDWEALSAFLDGQLPQRERILLEARLHSDAELSAALEELRRTRQVLRNLPRLRSPRNFTLSRQLVKQKRPSLRLSPVFGLASALASLLLLVIIVIDGLNITGGAVPVALQEADVSAMETAPAELLEVPMAVKEDDIQVEGETEIVVEEPSVREMPAEAALESAEELPDAEPAPLMVAEEPAIEEPVAEEEAAEEEGMSGVSADFMALEETPTEETAESSVTEEPLVMEEEAESTQAAYEPEEVVIPPEPPTEIPSLETEEIPEAEDMTQDTIPIEAVGEAETAPVQQSQAPISGRLWVRWVEIGLVLIALISGITALYLRRRGG